MLHTYFSCITKNNLEKWVPGLKFLLATVWAQLGTAMWIYCWWGSYCNTKKVIPVLAEKAWFEDGAGCWDFFYISDICFLFTLCSCLFSPTLINSFSLLYFVPLFPLLSLSHFFHRPFSLCSRLTPSLFIFILPPCTLSFLHLLSFLPLPSQPLFFPSTLSLTPAFPTLFFPLTSRVLQHFPPTHTYIAWAFFSSAAIRPIFHSGTLSASIKKSWIQFVVVY